jgi:hypothetical protein
LLYSQMMGIFRGKYAVYEYISWRGKYVVYEYIRWMRVYYLPLISDQIVLLLGCW